MGFPPSFFHPLLTNRGAPLNKGEHLLARLDVISNEVCPFSSGRKGRGGGRGANAGK